MKRLSLNSLLFLALAVSTVPTLRAQPNPDISWIYGIWNGGIQITDKVRNTYETVIVNFRINEDGNTLTFQYRGCNAQWVLESNLGKEAVFRERIIFDKKMPKPSKDSNRCRDGGAIVFYPLTDRYGTTRLGFRYYLPGETIDEAKYNNRGFLSPSVPYRDSVCNLLTTAWSLVAVLDRYALHHTPFSQRSNSSIYIPARTGPGGPDAGL